MRRFEYKIFHTAVGELKEEQMNDLGKEGWQLITSIWQGSNFDLIFTREKRESTTMRSDHP